MVGSETINVNVCFLIKYFYLLYLASLKTLGLKEYIDRLVV